MPHAYAKRLEASLCYKVELDFYMLVLTWIIFKD
jgi:hypothetical protein